MADRKKQHFVSQFLLREFSSEKGLRTINLYNRKIDKIVENAPIKSQAQESNFYGRDTVFEEFLSLTENRAAAIVKKVLSKFILPDYDDKDYSHLLHFVMLFAFRTKASVINSENRINSAISTIAPFDKNLKDIDFRKVRIKRSEPGAFNLAYFMDNWVVTYDLNSILLVNNSKRQFFISDNPFIKYNSAMQRRKEFGLADGLINKGLSIFFPLSPNLCLFFYDSKAYNVTSVNRTILLKNTNDLYKINLLQSISSDTNIYFSKISESKYVKNLALEGLKHKVDKNIDEIIAHPENLNRKFLYSSYIQHKLNLNFSFIKESEKVEEDIISGTFHNPRNQEIIDWIKMDKTKLYPTPDQNR